MIYIRIFFSGTEMSGRFSRTIYVGNLPADIREWEVEDLFYKVGVQFTFLQFFFIICMNKYNLFLSCSQSCS